MKKFKILISSFVVITLLCVSCFSFASSMVSDAASGMGKTISNAASDAGKTVSEGMNNIKDGAMEARDNMINATDSLTNDIKDGIDRNSTTNNNTTTNTTTAIIPITKQSAKIKLSGLARLFAHFFLFFFAFPNSFRSIKFIGTLITNAIAPPTANGKITFPINFNPASKIL